MIKRRAVAAAVAVAATSLALAACSSGGGSTSTSSSGSTSSTGSSSKVSLVWWNNATGELATIYKQAVAGFEAAHPNVSIQDENYDSTTLQTVKIPDAAAAGDLPNIFQQWGGGAEASMEAKGELANLTSDAGSWIDTINGASGWEVNGQVYGIPYDLHVVGFWYNKADFAKAGITSTPTTLAELESDDTALKAAGFAPISVGGGDKWPDAFWWEYFALRECSESTIQTAMSSENFSASCFGTASTDLANFIKTDPFNSGYNATKAQAGTGSSAGLVATGKAAMELQGDWDGGVMQGLVSASAATALGSNLGWFPFPSITGAPGDATADLGGGDGMSCSASSSAAQVSACVQFLEYLDSPTYQALISGKASAGQSVLSSEASALSLPAAQAAQKNYASASYVELYFDTALPYSTGQNLDSAIADYFAAPTSANAAAIISSVSEK
jgi:raffinose/stachyose/melibiose transport system substrate-binding protein